MLLEDNKMKKCNRCDIEKPFNEFSKDKRAKDRRQLYCKECAKEMGKIWREANHEYQKDWYENRGGRERTGGISMHKNKHCAQYLGIIVNERLIMHLYPDAEMMPPGFPGYDFICNRDKKMDAKGSTTRIRQNVKSTVNNWSFRIRYNKLCDFFLCVAYDNVIDLNPLYIWRIPAGKVNDKSNISISETTIHKWDHWKLDIDKAQLCCTKMKENKSICEVK